MCISIKYLLFLFLSKNKNKKILFFKKNILILQTVFGAKK